MKDYTDMAFHLEQHPQAKAVVNFVPILVEQLHDYGQQFQERCDSRRVARDAEAGAVG